MGCEIKCDIEFKVAAITLAQETPFPLYHIEGLLHNDYGQTVSVELSSMDGVFVQSPLAMTANQTLNFTAGNPLIFIPNTGFTGGFSQVDVKATTNVHGKREIICHDVHNLTFPNLTGNQTNRVELSVSPNPVQTTTAVWYKVKTPETFDRGTMVFYSLSGTRVETRPVKAPEGTETFDLSGRAAGNYVLVFLENGRRLGQQIIVKK